ELLQERVLRWVLVPAIVDSVPSSLLSHAIDGHPIARSAILVVALVRLLLWAPPRCEARDLELRSDEAELRRDEALDGPMPFGRRVAPECPQCCDQLPCRLVPHGSEFSALQDGSQPGSPLLGGSSPMFEGHPTSMSIEKSEASLAVGLVAHAAPLARGN